MAWTYTEEYASAAMAYLDALTANGWQLHLRTEPWGVGGADVWIANLRDDTGNNRGCHAPTQTIAVVKIAENAGFTWKR